MSLLRTHSADSDQPADENAPLTGEPVGEQPTTVQSTVVPSTTDDQTVQPADYDDYAEDDAPVAQAPDDDIIPAADYGRGDYAEETPVTDDPLADETVPATATATFTPTTGGPATAAPVPTQRTTDEGRTVSQAVPVTATALDGPLLGDVDAAELRNRWQQVQGEFVDDPKAAVGGAADLVEQTAQAMVNALQQRQSQMRGLWQQDQADGTAGSQSAADTEQLRMMMQQYRTLFNALCEQ